MNVEFKIDLHIYPEQEERIAVAVEIHNKAYVLKIIEFYKYASRWYFIIKGDFSKELDKQAIQNLKFDTCYRLGYFLTEGTTK